MFVTTIIPTVGRSTLDTAVMSVLSQTLSSTLYEIVVVNDSGKPLTHASWIDSENIRVIETNRNERSVARNTGASIARGEYLHFLDDDDWIMPDVFSKFRVLALANSAPFLYGGARLVENKETVLYDIHLSQKGNCFAHMMAGEWIPTGSYLIQREAFFKAGGFTPAMSVYEDFDFTRRAALEVDFAFINEPALCILRGNDWNTTTPKQAYLKVIRKNSLNAREKILSHPAAYKRIIQSADTNYWRGHVLRTYASSLVWNLKIHMFSNAFARFVQIIGIFFSSGIHLLRSDYWKGLMKPHTSTIVNIRPVQNHL